MSSGCNLSGRKMNNSGDLCKGRSNSAFSPGKWPTGKRNLALAPAVLRDKPGLPGSHRQQAEPSSREAFVLAAVGCDWREDNYLGPKHLRIEG